jgi:Predicted Zn peptidase
MSLSEMLNAFLIENEITESAVADEIGINRETLSKFLKGETDLKFNNAIRIMKLLNLSEKQFVSMYSNEISNEESAKIESSERLSYLARNFDIPTFKKLGIISKRAKLEDYESQICSFFGFKTIYEYDDASLMPVLFSKSKVKIAQEKALKMRIFWLKCNTYSFLKIGNPYEFDKELLIEFLKRMRYFTEDTKYGYEKVVRILYGLGVTVLTQPYIAQTGAFGVSMIINDKPCIVITDMMKKYHKLWLTLLHELYHIIMDYDILLAMKYHISDSTLPDLILNEGKADQFALDVLVPKEIRSKLKQIVPFPYKMNDLANELKVDISILYGVYLETVPKDVQPLEFSKYSHILKDTKRTINEIVFDAIERQSLNDAIEKMKTIFSRIAI